MAPCKIISYSRSHYLLHLVAILVVSFKQDRTNSSPTIVGSLLRLLGKMSRIETCAVIRFWKLRRKSSCAQVGNVYKPTYGQLCDIYICVCVCVYVYVQGSPVEIQTTKNWNAIGHSMSAQ
jgi:hypothetical protein